MKVNDIGLGFVHTINNSDNGMPKGLSDCYAFGMTFGCKNTCPTLWKGKCDVIKENIEKLEFNEEEIKELKNIYNI